MNHRNRLATASLLALLSALSTNQAHAQCVPSDAFTTSIALRDQPFPYADLEPELTPTQIGNLPALPVLADEETAQRENAYISTALAADLGIAPHDLSGNLTVNPDWRRPNPQIRVRITTPATFSNWDEDDVFLDRASNAVFTVVGVIQDTRRIVWVYEAPNDDSFADSGEYKLFAEDTVDASGDRVRQVRNFVDGNNDGVLDGVTASVYCSPVGRSVRSYSNGATLYTHYTENDAEGGRLHETAARGNDSRFVLLIPHGGQIEDGTSEQYILFHAALGSFYGYNVPVSSWRVEGFWGDGQNSKRWHITATSLLEKSFPALQWLLGQPRYSTSFPFRRAVALHGFGEDDPDVIVGGNTSLNAKCHVATKIKAEPNMGPVAIRIYHDDEIIDVPDNTGRTVCRKGLDGSSSRNIVNRMAADGGIQIEQSEGVRASTTYRGGVAYGTAKAVGDLLTTTVSNACSIYADPVPEDDVADCPDDDEEDE
jgi:phage replication-related protein YjqB (UPF0714/DUF867 family)